MFILTLQYYETIDKMYIYLFSIIVTIHYLRVMILAINI